MFQSDRGMCHTLQNDRVLFFDRFEFLFDLPPFTSVSTYFVRSWGITCGSSFEQSCSVLSSALLGRKF
jgi:hypothetical protein